MTNNEAIKYLESIITLFENGKQNNRDCTMLAGEALEITNNYIEACKTGIYALKEVKNKPTQAELDARRASLSEG